MNASSARAPARWALSLILGLSLWPGLARAAGSGHGSTPAALTAWQAQTRQALRTLLEPGVSTPEAGVDTSLAAVRPLRAVAEEPAFFHQEFLLTLRSGRAFPVVLTWPRGAGRAPAVLCLHGHYGHRDSVYSAATVYRGFGARLAARGYVTLSLDLGDHSPPPPGGSLVARRLADLERSLDFLLALPQVDPARVGVAGLSLGGEMALWLGALDQRVAAVVTAGWLGSFAALDAEGHCPCWKVPGLSPTYEMVDLYALVAPRPLLCLSGERDPEFPLEAAQRAFAALVPAWQTLGAAQALEFGQHPGGHVFAPALAEDFFARWLGGERAPRGGSGALEGGDELPSTVWRLLAASALLLAAGLGLWVLRLRRAVGLPGRPSQR